MIYFFVYLLIVVIVGALLGWGAALVFVFVVAASYYLFGAGRGHSPMQAVAANQEPQDDSPCGAPEAVPDPYTAADAVYGGAFAEQPEAAAVFGEDYAAHSTTYDYSQTPLHWGLGPESNAFSSNPRYDSPALAEAALYRSNIGSIDDRLARLAPLRARDKRALDGAVDKNMHYFKKMYSTELDMAEKKRWWGANEY